MAMCGLRAVVERRYLPYRSQARDVAPSNGGNYQGVARVSQRDFRALGMVFAHLDRPDLAPPGALDHHESDWYRRYFRPT